MIFGPARQSFANGMRVRMRSAYDVILMALPPEGALLSLTTAKASRWGIWSFWPMIRTSRPFWLYCIIFQRLHHDLFLPLCLTRLLFESLDVVLKSDEIKCFSYHTEFFDGVKAILEAALIHLFLNSRKRSSVVLSAMICFPLSCAFWCNTFIRHTLQYTTFLSE